MADRYWVGGSGNWGDDTNHWAITDGGAPGAGNLPASTDDAHFTALSNATAYTVTVTAAGTKACRHLLFEAAPASSGTITFAGSTAFPNVTGNIQLLSGMSWTYTGTMTLTSTAPGNTLTWNSVSVVNPFVFNGVGGGWTFQDDFTSSMPLSMLNGALDFNGKAVTLTGAAATITHASGTFALTTGAATISLNGNITAAASGFTLVGSGSSWNLTNNITNVGGNALAFGNVTYTSGVTKTIPAGVTMTSLTYAPSGTATLTVNGDPTITGTLMLTGLSDVAPLTVTHASTAQDFTAGTVNLVDIQFQNITAHGAIPWSGTRLVDLGGNSNINFGNSPATQGGHFGYGYQKQKEEEEMLFIAAAVANLLDQAYLG